MSRGDLQEMEVGTKQSKTAVNSGAKAGDSMDTSLAGSYEDLGGPTPENYKTDDDSAKLREPKIKTVKDVVNKGAKPADSMQKMSMAAALLDLDPPTFNMSSAMIRKRQTLTSVICHLLQTYVIALMTAPHCSPQSTILSDELITIQL